MDSKYKVHGLLSSMKVKEAGLNPIRVLNICIFLVLLINLRMYIIQLLVDKTFIHMV